MKNNYLLRIACIHDPSNIIQTQDGELVCKCGVVVEEKMIDNTAKATASNLTLYHQVENGGDPKDMKVTNKKIHIYSSISSELSNVCVKLHLPDFIQKRIWAIYRLLRRKINTTKSKCAAFAIYIATRENGFGIEEIQVQEAIQSVFCVRNVPSMLKVISELNPHVGSLGIDTNTNHTPNYYLMQVMTGKQRLFSRPETFNAFKIRAINNFEMFDTTLQNRARMAVAVAIKEMGVTDIAE